jgi:hypothetical protein
VKNQQAFALRYLQPGSPYENIRIAPGDYGTSNLSNGGETITVDAANGDEIQSFTYDDAAPWSTSPDGTGPSLTIIYTNPYWYNDADNWRPSVAPDGTPGIEENDAPTDIRLDNFEVPENQAGILIGTLEADDPDFTDTFTYQIEPGPATGMFVIQGNKLYVGNTPLDYESSDIRVFNIRATDAAGLSVVSNVTILITDNNDAPATSAGGPYTIGEGQSLQLHGTASDQDFGQELTYQWDFDYNGTTFDINAAGLTPTAIFPDQGTRTIALRVTDNGIPRLSTISTATVTITNRNPGLVRNTATLTGEVLSTLTNTGTWGDVPADTVTLSASLGAITKNANGTWNWSYVPSAVMNSQVVTITANDEDGGASQATFTISATAAVASANVYYKESGFSALGVNQAIDTGRVVLRSGATAQTTTARNFTNYIRGLNGLVLDVPGLANTNLTASDFILRVAPAGVSGVVNPSTWPAAPLPTLVNVTPGNTTTAARVRLEWNNNVIQNTWLQIIVKSNANTGLTAPAVFYIGNAIGEVTGPSPYRLTVGDRLAVANAISGSVVSVSDMRDIDKNRRITIGDLNIVGQRISATVLLQNITIPAAGSAQEGAGSLGLIGPLANKSLAVKSTSSVTDVPKSTLPSTTTEQSRSTPRVEIKIATKTNAASPAVALATAKSTDAALVSLKYPDTNVVTANGLLTSMVDIDLISSVKKQTTRL